MSKKNNKTFILLSPPMFLQETGGKEQIVMSGYRCTCCYGTGYINKETCPICKGSGRLKAIVTIQWKPE